MTNAQKIDAYLQRINFTSTPQINFETLHALQRLHLQNIPYENLDILRNIPLSLDANDLFNKIVVRKRGGFCFELNALFSWLLRNLGFKVTDYTSRFLANDPIIPIRCHRVISVALDGEDYLCDVGVGRVVPRKPIPIVLGVENEQNGEIYRLEEDDFLGYVLCELKHSEWRKIFAFTKEQQLEEDFAMPSFYCEKHPDSIFRTMDKVHIFTEDGRKSVMDREVRIFSRTGVEVINPGTEAEYEELLRVHFGINLSLQRSFDKANELNRVILNNA